MANVFSLFNFSDIGYLTTFVGCVAQKMECENVAWRGGRDGEENIEPFMFVNGCSC